MKNVIKSPWFRFMPGTIAGLLVVLFLSGKIIDYPRGTPEGGWIGGIGVLVILVSVTAIHYLIYRLLSN